MDRSDQLPGRGRDSLMEPGSEGDPEWKRTSSCFYITLLFTNCACFHCSVGLKSVLSHVPQKTHPPWTLEEGAYG